MNILNQPNPASAGNIVHQQFPVTRQTLQCLCEEIAGLNLAPKTCAAISYTLLLIDLGALVADRDT